MAIAPDPVIISKKKYEAGQTKGIGKNRKGNYILMNSGQRFWPLDPRPEEIFIEDIAHSLSRQCRFSGHTNGNIYSVGQHSLLVAKEVNRRYGDPRLTLTALLHDASEMVLVDLPRPIKAMDELGLAYREIEDKIQEVMAEKYSLIYPFPKEVMEVDTILLITEQRDLMPWPTGEKIWFPELEPLKDPIVPKGWKPIKKEFLKWFDSIQVVLDKSSYVSPKADLLGRKFLEHSPNKH